MSEGGLQEHGYRLVLRRTIDLQTTRLRIIINLYYSLYFVVHHLMAEHSHENEIVPSIAEPSSLVRSEQCVICLDLISEKAVALPCQHEQFDFPCLGTWLQRQQVCPLCKAEVKAIKFNFDELAKGGSKIFHLPALEFPSSGRRGNGTVGGRDRQRRLRHGRQYSREGRNLPAGNAHTEERKESSLDFRRHVYRNQLYSLHVGTNRISRYRNLAPASFIQDERLTSRARMWIRRELQVFDFLNSNSLPSSKGRSTDRRANNADFLLEYIIAILKSIDLKGSTGQAEELLKDFLGRDNARLFLHELEAWLRSPYEYLRDWDRAVQYAITEPNETRTSRFQGGTESYRHPRPSSSSNDTISVPRWFSDRFVLEDDPIRTGPI
ncbi:uncharacterized protein Z518_02235 [Rhinocladiella mackenziei CBS 650.93]|uniref:RING-type E3 ubiquitin transferase n=1 Tax=Rhinocladiella mackenziei CBS 650.93 TaxID=1442369 RepID=A0A0D2FZ83_9EURO|nr:uncharacterized protein Z518_02235 [Rhinocladiella mackenziei CBS 650.93]KIX07582.1 hypothetical protein Z518_02235 [Rhinocladiella mackenziei CBS 650.93]